MHCNSDALLRNTVKDYSQLVKIPIFRVSFQQQEQFKLRTEHNRK